MYILVTFSGPREMSRKSKNVEFEEEKFSKGKFTPFVCYLYYHKFVSFFRYVSRIEVVKTSRSCWCYSQRY